MEKAIYPYKFVPIPKEKVWGGHHLAAYYGKNFESVNPVGESWDICGFEGESSVVAEGFLAKNQLYDIIETYMDEILGEDHYKRFGNEFPLLVKTLDIQNMLSVQVHPDDDTAFDRHNSYGKHEAWYILDSQPESKVYIGFKQDVTVAEYLERCAAGTLEEVVNEYHPKKGDFFYIPAGTIHAAGGGVVLLEIQQLSDITYRIYDWGRENDPATAREMHRDLALSCIDYAKYDEANLYKRAGDTPLVHPENHGGGSAAREIPPRRLVANEYFTVTEHHLSDSMRIYTEKFESFILYTCTAGSAVIRPDGDKKEYTLGVGEWILIPAGMKDFLLSPAVHGTKVLEVYIEKEEDIDGYVEEEHDEHCDCGCHEHGHDCGCHNHMHS